MGHLVGKDLYRQLGKKIDGLTLRAPWNDALYALLKELYSEDDAALILKLPYGFSPMGHLVRVTGMPPAELEPKLASLCERGLVMDVCVAGRYFYGPSPMMIGIFEFTMMRTDAGADHATWARLFHDYLEGDAPVAANFGGGQQVALLRTLPHEGTILPDEHVEVLDYERATAIIEATDRFSLGLCACRHEQHHLGTRACTVPLDNCAALGAPAVDYLVRHGFAREVSKTEMLENVARSRELGLVLNADNVQRNVSYMCHCCSCCCHVLRGITKQGYPNVVVTSSFIAASDRELCKGCGTCSRRCPIDAIPRTPDPDPRFRKHGRPAVDEARCIGCGVCAAKCHSGAMKLHPRPRRILPPETTFERMILQCLERGTLQNQLFDDPSSTSQAFMRGLVGGFLRLAPVKQALMSDALRSRFLGAMKGGARRMGKQRLTEI